VNDFRTWRIPDDVLIMSQEIAPRPSKAPNFEVREVAIYESTLDRTRSILQLTGEGQQYTHGFQFGTIWVWAEKEVRAGV
jgi:hypothetical protein